MRNPHQTFFPILTTLILCLPAAMQADNVTYTWVSSDGDPFGINGTIVLDSSASSAGSFADVVSITISTPLYTDNVNLSSDTLIDFTAAWTPSGYFDWNPTQITDMGLTQFGPKLGRWPSVCRTRVDGIIPRHSNFIAGERGNRRLRSLRSLGITFNLPHAWNILRAGNVLHSVHIALYGVHSCCSTPHFISLILHSKTHDAVQIGPSM